VLCVCEKPRTRTLKLGTQSSLGLRTRLESACVWPRTRTVLRVPNRPDALVLKVVVCVCVCMWVCVCACVCVEHLHACI